MKYKGILISTALALVITVGGIYVYNDSNKKTLEQTYYGHGKHEEFESIEEMENKSTLIIVGKKLTKEKPTIFLDGVKGEDGYEGVAGGYTISEFQVKKVIKNTSGKEIKKNDIIPILENAATDTIGDGKKKVSYSLNGYELMKKGKHYVLFTDESSSDPGTFVPVGAVYGKASLENTKGDELEFSGDSESVKKLIKEAKSKYKKEIN
ncbi:hypothetical protein [Bacillus sp. FJAT-47783]|uniref:hypothetical protein n=1 Tax=Bacillus sp. FJAT-47783 TaxID=2922712 RepID=UPI001FABCE6B|nr:hypothetical protein [Bacillus sp. FJAT-47783]